MFITLLVFLAILGLLVFIHELGHFLVAKRNGVLVHEFAFGFRPRLLSKKIGETTYALNLIPLGGYVRLYGEHEGETGERSFREKTAWQRFQVLVAGSTMNLLLGWLLLTILFMVGFQPIFPGVEDNPFVTGTKSALVGNIADNSPAALAGLQKDDRIISVDGQSLSTSKFIEYVSAHRGEEVTVKVSRGAETFETTMTPRVDPPAGEGALGVALVSGEKVQTSVLNAPVAGIYETGRIIGASAAGFGTFMKNLVVKQEVSEDVTGLIGVGALTGVARRLGIDYLAQLVVIITIGLGVINLMPILPLDGGHIAVLGYEKVTGRPLSERHLGILVAAGLAFVLLMFIVITYKDILRFDVFSRLF